MTEVRSSITGSLSSDRVRGTADRQHHSAFLYFTEQGGSMPDRNLQGS